MATCRDARCAREGKVPSQYVCVALRSWGLFVIGCLVGVGSYRLQWVGISSWFSLSHRPEGDLDLLCSSSGLAVFWRWCGLVAVLVVFRYGFGPCRWCFRLRRPVSSGRRGREGLICGSCASACGSLLFVRLKRRRGNNKGGNVARVFLPWSVLFLLDHLVIPFLCQWQWGTAGVGGVDQQVAVLLRRFVLPFLCNW